MANIALNKPSGGQLILSPEDGTSTETIVVPAAGIMGADTLTGKVIQEASVTTTATTSTASSSWIDVAGLSLNFTPKRADSKIYGMVAFPTLHGSTNAVQYLARLIRDGSTDLAVTKWGNSVNANIVENGTQTLYGVDTPNSTATMNYKVQTVYSYYAGSYGTQAINPNGYLMTLSIWEVAA